MSVTLKGSSIKLRNSDNTITEPSFLKGDDAKTIYSYGQDGGYVETQTEFISSLNNPTNPYPIGSVFISASSISPASTYGGTWEQITDKFLLCAGDTYIGPSIVTDRLTGGEATHVLTTTEMPSHTHTIYLTSSVSIGWGRNLGIYRCSWSASSWGTTWTGGGQAHENMPPYIVKNIWIRTA